MTVEKKLSGELQTLCKDAGVDFTKTSQELSEFIGDEELVDYFATQGPLPGFPNTIFDIMLLNNKYLYDFEMRQQGALHHILPLRTIIEIIESFEKQEEEDYLSISFRVSALEAGLVIQCKLSDKKDIRRFASAVKRKLGEST